MEPAKPLPSVSICVPCIPKYIPYLFECLSSILNSYTLPEEVILYISDATPFVKKYVEDKIRPFIEKLNIKCIFVTEKQDMGANTKEAIINQASGDIIIGMNPCDMMYPDKITIVKIFFSRYPKAVGLLNYFIENATYDVDKVKEGDLPLNPYQSFKKYLVKKYAFHEQLHFGNACFRRFIFEKNPYTEEIEGEFLNFVEQILPRYRKDLFIYDRDPLTLYNSYRRLRYSDYSERMYELIRRPKETARKIPSVSICIPCIPKHVKHLCGLFESIIKQTMPPKQVILVVSESNPTVEKKVMELANQFPELKIKVKFFTGKQYAGTNRNACINVLKKQIIDSADADEDPVVAFIDADDEMCPNRTATITEFFYRYPKAKCLVHYFKEYIDEECEEIPTECEPFDENRVKPYRYCEELHCGHPCLKLSLFNEASYSDDPRGQDIKFINELLKKNKLDTMFIYEEYLTIYIPERSSHNWELDIHLTNIIPQKSHLSSSDTMPLLESSPRKTEDLNSRKRSRILSFHPNSPNSQATVTKMLYSEMNYEPTHTRDTVPNRKKIRMGLE